MDRRITARFYQVSRVNRGTPPLLEVLRHIKALGDAEQRERKLAEYFDMRLEELDDDGPNVVMGELTRIQSTNLPSEVAGGRRRSLQTQNRLGHSVAFRFDGRTSVLVMQYEPRIISPGRFVEYIGQAWQGVRYKLDPIVREDMWERFDRGPTRKVRITVASPADLAVLGGAAEAASSSFRAMGRAYRAPEITVEISMGKARKGGLANRTKRMVASMLRVASLGTGQIKDLKAKTAIVEGGPSDEIDLLDELLVVKDTLEFHDRDPDVNYQIKCRFLRGCMHDYSP